MNCDLLVEGAAVVTVDSSWRIFDPGYIAVIGNRITGVGPAFEARGLDPGRRIDGRGRLVLPGFVNAHTHVSMAPFRSAGEDLRDRLSRFIFPMEKRLVDARVVYEGARFCLAEMARSGTTCFADMYYFEEEVARAAKEAGLRCLLGETVVDFPAPDAAESYGGMERARRFISDWKGDGLVTPCMAPHATYTVDEAHLREIRSESDRLGLPAMIHVAEVDREDERFRASHGSTVRYLDSIGFLDGPVLAAHMIYVYDDDIPVLAGGPLAVAHCPASNAKGGRPIAPVLHYLEAGIKVGLATDGPLSGNGMDMMGVLGLFPKLQKIRAGRRDAVSAREALRVATMGGAEALGLADLVGSIEVGKCADFAVYDAEDFNVQPVYDWYSAAVYALRPHNARTVVVDGRVVVDEGGMTGFDEAEAKAGMKAMEARFAWELQRLSSELA